PVLRAGFRRSRSDGRVGVGPFPMAVYLSEDEVMEVLPGIPNPNTSRSKPSPFTLDRRASSTETVTP
ncbi:MAG: hypothetical protein V3R24_10975, partial [Gemmatimonadales bacterium]